MFRHRRPRAEMIEVAERIDTHNARARRSASVTVFKVLDRVRCVHCGRFPRVSELCVHWLFSCRQHIVCRSVYVEIECVPSCPPPNLQTSEIDLKYAAGPRTRPASAHGTRRETDDGRRAPPTRHHWLNRAL